MTRIAEHERHVAFAGNLQEELHGAFAFETAGVAGALDPGWPAQPLVTRDGRFATFTQTSLVEVFEIVERCAKAVYKALFGVREVLVPPPLDNLLGGKGWSLATLQACFGWQNPRECVGGVKPKLAFGATFGGAIEELQETGPRKIRDV